MLTVAAPKANPRKVEKARAILAGATVGAARVMREMVLGVHPDAHAEKATNQLRAASLLVQGHLSMERAQVAGQTGGTRALGVIIVEKRLEDTPANRSAWEQEAARLTEGRAIEAVAVPVLPKREPDAA